MKGGNGQGWRWKERREIIKKRIILEKRGKTKEKLKNATKEFFKIIWKGIYK